MKYGGHGGTSTPDELRVLIGEAARHPSFPAGFTTMAASRHAHTSSTSLSSSMQNPSFAFHVYCHSSPDFPAMWSTRLLNPLHAFFRHRVFHDSIGRVQFGVHRSGDPHALRGSCGTFLSLYWSQPVLENITSGLVSTSSSSDLHHCATRDSQCFVTVHRPFLVFVHSSSHCCLHRRLR